MFRSISSKWLLVLAALVLVHVPAQAGFITAVATGSAQLVVPPNGTNLNPGQTQSALVRAFDENKSVLINATVNTLVSLLAPGDFIMAKGPAGLLTGLVDSHFLHFDPRENASTIDVLNAANGTPLNRRPADGFVTFSSPILGIDYLMGRQDATDAAFGLPGVIYPTGVNARDLEAGDDIWVSADRLTLFYAWTVTTVVDQVRVYTAASAVPAPASLLLLLSGGAGMIGVRLFRRKQVVA